jgi:YfiH family protein
MALPTIAGSGKTNGNAHDRMLIIPDWAAPARVKAVTTTRLGGCSLPPYETLNLGEHVGDNPLHVGENRRRIAMAAALPGNPGWLQQVHENTVVEIEHGCADIRADASCTRQSGVVCVVMTADCLPILLCDRVGAQVAAVHAGWRGLACGVISATVARMACSPAQILAWLGPGIGAAAFEVGDEVRQTFVGQDMGHAVCFAASPRGRWMADLYGLARRQLQAAGVGDISGGSHCTYTERDLFFSYRRDGITGRMGSFIWLA